MITENKYGRKFIIYDNLNDFFTEFKKYRAKKSDIASKENYSEHVFPSLEWNKEQVEGKDFGKLYFVDLDYTEPKTEPFWSLGLDISPIKLKEVGIGSEWDKQDRKIRKILHEIWETGSADTSTLDLSWPQDKNSKVPSKTEPANLEERGERFGKIVIVFCSVLVILGVIFTLASGLIKRRKNN